MTNASRGDLTVQEKPTDRLSRGTEPMRESCRKLILTLAMVMTSGLASARGQIIAIGPPSFQSNDFPSLETVILDRLALGASYDPLESIAMLADVQYDMPNTVMGASLEPQIRQLWDSASAYEERVSAGPMSAKTLVDAQPLYTNMQGALQSIESTMGSHASVSNRVAAHLAGITRLGSATGTLMHVIESDLQAAVPVPQQPAGSADRLGTPTRLLANGVVAVIQNVKASKHEGSDWRAVLHDLDELFGLVQSLEKTLASQPTTQQIEQALRAVRQRMWRTEARIARIGWPTDLERPWRGVREQLNLISDDLGLARIIDFPQAAIATEGSATGPPATRAVRVYRGPPGSSALPRSK
jgi:hypothetical protein